MANDKSEFGRPTKLTPKMAQLVVENIRKNLSVNNAARIAKLAPQTPFNWMKQGEEDKKKGLKTIHTDFLDSAREAQGLKIAEMIEKIELMPKGWQAVSWLLEKCCPDEFGKDVELYKQLHEDYKRLLQILADNKQG